MTSAWLTYVVHAGWQALLVSVLMLAVAQSARRLPPVLRHGLLAVALLKFLCPPFLTAPTGVLAMIATPTAAAGSRDLVPAVSSAIDAVVPWLAGLHAVGALSVCALAFGAARRLRRWRRGGQPACDPLAGRAGSLARRLGVERAPRLILSPDAPAPFASGVIRPVIILPQALPVTLTPSEMDAVLAHELLHHRHRHPAWNVVRVFACAIWWWHPAVWLVARALRAAQEEACDDGVIAARVVDAASYCDALIAAAIQPAPRGLCAFGDRLHPMARRLRRLLDAPRSAQGRPNRAASVLVGGIALLVLPGVPQVDQARPARPLTTDIVALAEMVDGPVDRLGSAFAHVLLEGDPAAGSAARAASRNAVHANREAWRAAGRELGTAVERLFSPR
jgi:beta-lactamase regulating signal transducer with metallopeptidase domain